MKRFVLPLMLTVLSLIVFPIQSFGQDIPDDGEEIEIDINNNSSDTGPRRSSSLPMTAFFYQSISCIEVFFQYNIGFVTISLTNLTAGGYSTDILVDSQSGSFIIPFVSVPGIWLISFLPEVGPGYSGLFSCS